MIFPVVMYRCENWTIKQAECQRIDAFELWCWRRLLRVPWTARRSNQRKAVCHRIDAFELWCWRRLLRVPWTARRSNQSILKEISPEHSLEGLKMKLKLQYFGHLMQRTDSLEKTLMLERLKAGGEGDDRGWDSWMASLSEFEHAPGAGDGQGSLACCSPWGHKELDTTEQLNWIESLWNGVFSSVQFSCSVMQIEVINNW